MPTPQIPFLLEGEILSVQKRREGERNVIRYSCRAFSPDGGIILLKNVEESGLYGGLGDYYRRRSRARTDADYPGNSFDSRDVNASVGERVYILLLNGSIYNPIIIGYKQHPQQTDEFEEPSEKQPQMIDQYLGVRRSIDETGQYRIIHKGAPKVVFQPESNSPLAAAQGLLSASSDGPAPPGDNNPSLEPADTENLSAFEMLDKGNIRLRNSLNLLFEFDTDEEVILLSTNKAYDFEDVQDVDGVGLGGGLSADTDGSDFIELNKSEKRIQISARNLLSLISEDAYEESIAGDYSSTIEGEYSQTIAGNCILSIESDLEATIDGGFTISVTGDSEQTAKSHTIADSSGGVLKIANGKVALGGQAGELLDLVSQTLEQVDTLIQAMTQETHLGNLGFATGPPLNAATYTQVQTQLKTIAQTLNQITGSL